MKRTIDIPPGYGTFFCDENGPVPMSENEALLVALVKILKPHRLAEIGVSIGQTTVCLAYNAPDDAVLYALDVNIDRPRYLIEELGLSNKIILIAGDSRHTVQTLPDDIDFAYVDGEHAYEYVRSDGEQLWPKLSNGAVMAFHDANSGPVSQYVRERFPSAFWFPWGAGLTVVQKN